MIETRCLKNVVIFLQTNLRFVLSRKVTDIQFSIKYTEKNFHNCLPSVNINSFSLNTTDEIEVQNIIMSLNPLKAIGRNLIPAKFLKSIINDASSQLLFSVVFSH